ncbi:hypothetical protein [Pseudoclavibacter helvolus]|uniref:hypothetical protein n=1 Tax=Pseudoclavibacter helvolus TaxID=255205 RepID=UPI003C75D9E9
MTLPENRKPEALEKNEVREVEGVVLIERLSKRTIQIIIPGGRKLTIRSGAPIWAYEGPEEDE